MILVGYFLYLIGGGEESFGRDIILIYIGVVYIFSFDDGGF